MNAFAPLIPPNMPAKAVSAGFTTRFGGVSLPPYDSLNFGYRTGDDPHAVAENHRLLTAYVGVDTAQVAIMRQVHGTVVCEAVAGGDAGECDGLITAVTGLMLLVRTADCLPLLLYDPVNHVAGAVHCGWRSLTGGIAERALALMSARFGTDPADVSAAVGPGAGQCCYEIGAELIPWFMPDMVANREGRWFADLAGELDSRLNAAGIGAGHRTIVGHCTVCSPDRYYSHRRDGVRSGRMAGFIALR